MATITATQDRTAKAFLADLSREHTNQLVPQRKSMKDFANLAIPPMPRGKRASPASWTVDRNEYVKHFKGTTFIAVGAIAKKIAQQEPTICRRVPDGSDYHDEAVEYNHPLRKLFREVNQIHTQYDLWFQMVAWRKITGDSYWWKTRNGFGKPVELWPLPSQWVWAIPSHDKFIGEYLVKHVWDRDTYLDPKDVLHVREPSIDWSGNGKFYGKPTAAAGATAIDLEEQMFARLYHQFKNFAPPGLHYATEEELGEEQFVDLMAQIRMQHADAEKSGEPIFSHSGMKVSEFRQSIREMDYGNSLMTVMDYLLAIYGTPKAVVGLSRDYNKANLIGATMAWIENEINPLLKHLGQHLTQGLASEFGDNLIIKFPPASVNDRDSLRKDIEACMKSGAMTPNEIREELLDKPAYKVGGDRPLVQGSLAEAPIGNSDEPVEDPRQSKPAAPPDPGMGDDDDTGQTPEQAQAEDPEDDIDSTLDVDSEGRLKDATSEVVAQFFRGRRRLQAKRAAKNGRGYLAADPQTAGAVDGGGLAPAAAKAEENGAPKPGGVNGRRRFQRWRIRQPGQQGDAGPE